MIVLHQLVKQYGNVRALNQVNLDLKASHSYALVGPNGSGKTTLIKSILGLVVPTSGTILINGSSIAGQHNYRRQIGYMPQISRYPDNLRIGQLFEMIRNLRSEYRDVDEELIQSFGLTQIMDKRMSTLSGGTRQKVGAAIAFLFKPQVLILDEPTAGLDPIATDILKEKVTREKNAGKLFLITSHILSDLEELATDIIYMQEGAVYHQSSLHELQTETGQSRLGQAISMLIRTREQKIKELLTP